MEDLGDEKEGIEGAAEGEEEEENKEVEGNSWRARNHFSGEKLLESLPKRQKF